MAGRQTVVRRQLGRRLRRLRFAAGRAEKEVEKDLKISRTKLWRIETGQVPVKVNDVRAMCWFYGVDGDLADALLNLSLGTESDGGWLEDYSDVVPDWFRLYVELEDVATRIRVYEGEVVPGLLQTAEYARHVFRAAQPDDPDKAIERRVTLRMERQEALLKRVPPPRMVFVLSAGVLARQVGGAAVTREQVVRLRQLDERAHVEIRVLPWDSGAHAAMAGGFHIFDFADPEDPDVVYLETQTSGRYLEEKPVLDEYRRVFALVYNQSAPLKEYR